MRYTNSLVSLALGFLLAACGGGGGNPGTNTCCSSSPSTTAPATTVAIYDASGNAVNTMVASGSYTARATVRTNSGSPVAGTVVSFSVVGAAIAILNPNTALTNASGVAEVAISPATASSAGAATLLAAATVSGSEVKAQVDFAVQAAGSVTAPSLNVAIYDASGKAVTNIAAGGQYTARATLKNAAGAPVASSLVSFSLSGAAVATLSPNTALTNSAGVAEVTIAPASAASVGAATLLANSPIDGAAVSGQVNFAVQAAGSIATPSLIVAIYDATGNVVTNIAAGGQYTARAAVKNASGAPVVSALVNFSLVGATVASLSPNTALTNSAGIAEVSIAPASASSVGAATLLASSLVAGTGVSAQVNFAVQASSVVTVPTVTVGIYDSLGNSVTSIAAGGRYTARVSVKGGSGLPVASTLVTYGVVGAAIATLSPNTALTNSLGVAEVAIAPVALSSLGAASLSASAVVAGTTASARMDFAVQASSIVTEPALTVAIFDAGGNSVNTIAVGGAYTARATVKDSNRLPVASTLVNFSLGGASIATLSPATALTNSAGVAEVAIAPSSLSSIGAASLSASSQVAGASVSGQKDFSVQASSLSLSTVSVGSANLPSGGNTPVQVTALIGGAPSTGLAVNVSFAASCGRINGQDTSAGGVSVTTNGSGVAAAVYDAVTAGGALCSGAITVTASSAGASPKSTSINVAAPSANAVVFVSAAPSQIFVSGSGAVEQAILKFSVLSSVGTPMSNVAVKFSIVTNPGGVGLAASGSTGPVTATTSATGEASVAVFSGTIPGPVKVRAELVSNSAVFAESQNSTVASGPPSQRFMSLSVETFNIEGWNLDGINTQLTVRVADRQGNAVQDGTVVNFTTEGGQVDRSCATARVAGISQCSVRFQSQNFRPANGRVSVLAYVEGTKDYVDVNGNNRYDAGIDTLLNIGDAYRDDNENNSFDASSGEFVLPRGGTLACPGSGGAFPARVNTCDNNLSTTVRQQAVILLSSSAADLVLTSDLARTGIFFRLNSVSPVSLLPLPSGTSVTAEALDVNSADGLNCSIAGSVSGSPIPNINPGFIPSANLGTSHGVTLKDCRPGDQVTIKVRVPSGLATTYQFTLP